VVNEAPEPPRRRVRGPGKNPALECTSIRLPVHVLNYFTAVYGRGKQKAMRDILTKYVDNLGESNGSRY